MDVGTARRQAEPRSFIPRQMGKEDNSISLAKVHQRDQQRGPPNKTVEPAHKYQQLKKIPSSNTSTTGGMTPLFDNTGTSSPLSSRSSGGEDNRKHPIKPDHVGVRDKMPTKMRVSHPAVSRRSDYYYGKYFSSENETDGIANLDVTEDDIESSSCSTLTTTKSMMVQQQECTITVTDTTGTKPTQGKKQKLSPNHVAQRREIQVNSTAVVKKGVPEQRRQPADSSARLPVVKRPAGGASSNRLAHVPVMNNAKIQAKPQKVAVKEKNSSSFATTLNQVNVPVRPVAAIMGSTETTKPPDTNRVQKDFPNVESNDSDDFVFAKEPPHKNAPMLQSDRVGFFPVPAFRVDKHSDGHTVPRLGVTSKFPSRQPQPAKKSRKSVETGWDPLHDYADNDPFPDNSSFGEGKPLTWATFETFEDLDTPASVDVPDIDGYPIFSFPDPDQTFSNETTDTFSLLENIDLNTESFDGGRSNNNTHERPGIDKEDTQKTKKKLLQRTSMTQKRQPSSEFFKKPQLLGPLLERSYWLKLKETKKEAAHKTQSGYATRDTNQPEERTMERSLKQVQEENLPIAKAMVIEAPKSKEEDRWKALPDWQGPEFVGRDLQEDRKGRPSITSSKESVVLSPRRVIECHAVLSSIAIPQILKVIDEADASSPLTLKQTMQLRSLVPTPVEHRRLVTHLQAARNTPVCVVFPAKGERFALELSLIGQVRKKLEAIMFQLEFNGVVDVLVADMAKFTKRAEEILSLGEGLASDPWGRDPIKKDVEQLKDKFSKLCNEVAQLEDKFEAFRKFAVALSISANQRTQTTGKAHPDGEILTVQSEIDVMQTTSIGRFCLDSCLLLAELYEAFDKTQDSVSALSI